MTPLTALKFSELVVRAGFPPGVINILPGKGQLFYMLIIVWHTRAHTVTHARTHTHTHTHVRTHTHTHTGRIVGQALTDHPDIRKIGFTGSTGVGQTIMKSAAESNVKKVSLELGGKSPLIIFGDCELDKAVRLVSMFRVK